MSDGWILFYLGWNSFVTFVHFVVLPIRDTTV